MERTKDEIFQSIMKLMDNPVIQKTTDTALRTRRLFLYGAQIAVGIGVCITGANSPMGRSAAGKILIGAIISIILANVMAVVKEIILYRKLPQLDMLQGQPFDRENYEAMLKKERDLNRLVLICNLFNYFAQMVLGVLIGGMFVFGGIYAAVVQSRGQDRVMMALLIPLMGLICIGVTGYPFFVNVYRLKHFNDDPEALLEMEKKPKFTANQIMVMAIGCFFGILGICLFGSGIDSIVRHEIGQAISMLVMGLLVTGVGGLCAWFGSKISDQE